MKGDSIVNWLDSARVKVLLFPLSDLPSDSFKEYSRKFNGCKHVELSELASKESDDIILRKLGRVGYFNYNFLTSVDSALNDFIDFQLHQRVFGVFGIVDGRSNKKSKKEIDEILNGLKDKFSYDVLSEVLIFEPIDSPQLEGFNHITTDDDLKQVVKNCTSKIIENMSELLSIINQRPAIPSPCGIEDYSGTTSRASSSKTRMRLSGRAQKLSADLHLLTGSYSEAVACYVSATEDARVSNDTIWSAASQEGFNTALCLQNEQLLPPDDNKTEMYKSLIDKLGPLSIVYERSGTPILSIELQITCSRIHRFIKQGTAALTVLSEAWKSCNLLAFDDKLLAYNRILRELAAAGNWRKWSLYMVQMAQTLKLAQKPEMALITLSKTLQIYNLTQSKEYQIIKGWPAVQSALLKEMVKLSETNSNRLVYFLYGWMYLVHSNRCQEPADQMQIIEDLRKKSNRDMFSLSSQDGEVNSGFVCSLPIFVKLSLEKGNSGGLFISEKQSNSEGSGPFIYNPNRSKTANNTGNSNTNNTNGCFLKPDESLISGESATFKLVLSNPFVFPIVLKNIYLITDDETNDSLEEQVSITLSPMKMDQIVLINFKPKREGKLKVLGLCATFMNVEIQFLINSKGKIHEGTGIGLNQKDNLGIELDVIESQPFLECSSDLLRDGLQLYEGESIVTLLSFTNLCNNNKNEIKMINFKVNEEQKVLIDSEFEINEIIFENDQETTFKIEFEIKEPLEIPFKVPLKIFGTRTFGIGLIKTATLEIFYSISLDSDKIYWRRLLYSLNVTICPIIKIDQFSFHLFKKTLTDKGEEEREDIIELSSTSSPLVPIPYCPSLLSKFKHLNWSSNDYCVGSFIIYNLESCFKLDIIVELVNIVNCSFIFNENLSNQSGKRIFFIIPRLPKTIKMKNQKKLPLNEKKIAAVRRLRRPTESDNFLDDTFEDFLYDSDQFWIKRYLIENLKINWKEHQQEANEQQVEGRNGKVSLSQCDVPFVYHDSIFKEHLTVSVDFDEFTNIKIGQELIIKFTICPEEGRCDYKLKLFPIVILTDKEVALNFERVIQYSGCLDSFVRDASPLTPQIRTFKFYPISTAIVKIIYQVVELKSGEIHWCKNPILIETTRIK